MIDCILYLIIAFSRTLQVIATLENTLSKKSGLLGLHDSKVRLSLTILHKESVKAVFHFCTFGGFTSRRCSEEEISILFLPDPFSIFHKLLCI